MVNEDRPLTTIYWGELKQYGNHVCAEVDPLYHFERSQVGIFVFLQKETGAESVVMATTW